MSQKKTLFIITGLGYGGAEKMLVNIVNHLDRERIIPYIIILSIKRDLEIQLSPKVKIFEITRKFKYDFSVGSRINKIIQQYDIDTILAFGLFEYFFVWLGTILIKKKPKVLISIHNIKQQGIKGKVLFWFYARLLRGNEIIISVCKTQASYWSKQYRIPINRFINIYNGVDIKNFSYSNKSDYSDQVLLEKYGLGDEDKIISIVASLNKHKRHEIALLAFKLLICSFPEDHYKLILVGSGDLERKNKLQKICVSLSISDNVVFAGSQQDVRPFYRISDIFCLTSAFETFSVAALEAMAMGVPCVLTDVGGASEMVINGFNGYLSKPNDSQSIMDGWVKAFNKKDWNHSRIAGYVQDNFNIDRCVENYQDLILNQGEYANYGISRKYN